MRFDDVVTASFDAGVAARAWHHEAHAAVCDVLEPWAHGTIVRATRHTSYFDLNVVRVEEDLDMGAAELAAFADEALAGLGHRRVDVELASTGARLRPGLEALGFTATRLMWMHHEGPPPPGAKLAVDPVPYDDVAALRIAWHEEDSPGRDEPAYHAQAREVALERGAEVLAVRDGGVPVAFAQLSVRARGAEIEQVYVQPERRGGGLGTALTRAAIAAAGDARELWIVADADDRPRELYARLGFRPAWETFEFLRVPGGR